MMKLLLTYLFSALVLAPLGAEQVQLEELSAYADGLNIEGGLVAQRFLGPKQTWANLCLVLDRPFHNDVDWDELTAANPYPLKEASIPEFNERHTVWIHASILRYYIQQAQFLMQDEQRDTAELVVQVHRNTSGVRYLEVLRWIVQHCLDDLGAQYELEGDEPSYLFPEQNCRLLLRYGYELSALSQREEVDVVLSLSLVAGLHPDWPSGSSMVPESFVPFDIHSMVLANSLTYASQNHLLEVRKELIASQSPGVLEIINRDYASANPDKQGEVARPLEEADFRSARILQASGVFCPKQLPERLDVL